MTNEHKQASGPSPFVLYLSMNIKSFRLFRNFKLAWLLICLTGATASRAQDSNSPPASPLSVDLLSPRNGAMFHASANVRIYAHVALRSAINPADSAKVEFFAGTNSLGSRTSFWRGQQRPPDGRPGQPMPAYIAAAGFTPVEWIWTNPPPGNYTLTAKATYLNGSPAVSKPVNIVVQPASAPPATGH